MKSWYRKYSGLTDSAKSILDVMGYTLSDSDTHGEYELYVFKAGADTSHMLSMMGIPEYQLAFQRYDTDFSDMDQQMSSNPPSSENIPLKEGIAWLKTTILSWISQYGQMVVMSHSEDKNTVYRRMLNRMGIGITEREIFDPATGNRTVMIIG